MKEELKEPYVNSNDVCKYLKIAKSAFYKLCVKGLPRVRLTKRSYRYKLSEIETWMREQTK